MGGTCQIRKVWAAPAKLGRCGSAHHRGAIERVRMAPRGVDVGMDRGARGQVTRRYLIPNLITVGDEAEAIAARHLRVRYGDVVAHGRDILYPDAEPSHRHDMHCACLDLLSLAGRRLPSPLYERYYLYLWRCFLSDTTYTYGAAFLAILPIPMAHATSLIRGTTSGRKRKPTRSSCASAGAVSWREKLAAPPAEPDN